MWTNLITYILEKEGYPSQDKKFIPKSKGFSVSNPFVTDRSPSAFIWSRSGVIKLYNSDIDGKDKLEIWEWTKLLGYYSEYVSYIANYYEISIKELYNSKNLCDRYHIADVGKMVDDIDFTVNKLSSIEVKPTTNVEEVELSLFEKEKAIEYIESLRLSVEDGIRPCRVRMYNENFEMFRTAICYDYKNSNYRKYRFIGEVEKRYRFLAQGTYGRLYVAQLGFTNKCIVCEAEKEAIVYSKYSNDSVFGISGTSLPNNIEELKDYEHIEVLLDIDKFYERCWSIYNRIREVSSTANIVIRPKLIICYENEFDTTVDLSDFHKYNKLTKSIIETGMLSSADIVNNVEYYDFLLDK